MSTTTSVPLCVLAALSERAAREREKALAREWRREREKRLRGAA